MHINGLTRRLVQLYIGLALYGLSGALLVRSELGLDPWDVLHQGIARHAGLAIGTVAIIVGAAVLLLWIPLRQLPGIGTISNVVLIGVWMNISLMWLPHVHHLPWRIADMVSGVALCGVATGLYIGAHFGPGPRDGLMTGLARKTGRSIRFTRTLLEATVLVTGWFLGGTVGIGTVLFAVSIGPLAQLFMRIFDVSPVRGPRHLHEPATSPTDPPESRNPGTGRRMSVAARRATRG
ncbi:MAG: hypothetical protein ABI232_13445 [Jatrophihabitantaceae bacterium]